MNDKPDTSCALDDCKCDTVPVSKNFVSQTVNIIQLIKPAVLALACLFIISVIKMSVVKANVAAMLQAKKENTILCASNKAGKESNKNKQPGNGNNNCFHQQLTACICETKRRQIKTALS